MYEMHFPDRHHHLDAKQGCHQNCECADQEQKATNELKPCDEHRQRIGRCQVDFLKESRCAGYPSPAPDALLRRRGGRCLRSAIRFPVSIPTSSQRSRDEL